MSQKVAFFLFVSLWFFSLNFVLGKFDRLNKIMGKKTTDEITTKHILLETPLKVNRYGKHQEEAFLALLTQPLGFMNCDTRQAPLIKRYLFEYQEYKKGHKMRLKKLKKLFDSNEPWCDVFLRDPVFQDNRIEYKPYPGASMKLLDKVVHFEYFSKEDEVHPVIQCPVAVRKQHALIYFSALGWSELDGFSYYFVLTAYLPNNDSKLVILMRTKFHVLQSNADDGMDCFNKYIPDLSEEGRIQLNIKPARFKDEYRLFGKYAESVFISTEYGFWNPTIKRNILYKFIDTTLVLSKGYEIERRKLKKHSALKEGPEICRTHINTSRLLKTYGIKYTALKGGKIKTVKQDISSFIEGIQNHKFKFLVCPVTKGTESGFILLHPIYYKSSTNFSYYDLFWYVATDGDFNGREVLLFLAPNKNAVEQSGKKVQFVGV